MSSQVQKSIKSVVEECRYFSLAVDECTDIKDTSQLLIFIRTINSKFEIHEEMLDIVALANGCRGTDLFDALNYVIGDYGGFNKLSCLVTDRALAMTGKKWVGWNIDKEQC